MTANTYDRCSECRRTLGRYCVVDGSRKVCPDCCPYGCHHELPVEEAA